MIRRPPRSPLFPYTPLSRSLSRARRWLFRHQESHGAISYPIFLRRQFRRRGEQHLYPSARAKSHRQALQSGRSEEHTSELQSPCNLVCRLLLEKKKKVNTHEQTRKWMQQLETAHNDQVSTYANDVS